MKGLILLITVIVAVEAVPKTYTNKKTLIEDLKLHCDSLCSTYDGVFEFNEKQKICTCYVGKFFDDTEVTLMRKNAKAMGMNLKTIKSTPKSMSKRDTSEQEHLPIATIDLTKKKSIFPEKKASSFNNPKEKQSTSKFQLKTRKFSKTDSPKDNDSIVGARANPPAFSINSRANSLQPLQPGAMKDVWLKARQRLDHLIKHSDGGKFNSRFAASETQAIRNALKPLTLKKKTSGGSKPFNSQGRSSGLSNTKHGGGLQKNSKGLKVASNRKPSPPNQKLFQPKLSPLSLQPQNKISGLFNSNAKGLIKPRMNSHVGSSGPSENAEGIPNVMSSTTSTTTEQSFLKVVADKSFNKVAERKQISSKRLGKKDREVKHIEKNPSNIVVQPKNTISNEEDESED